MKKREIKERYKRLTSTLDQKNLVDLRDRRPDIVEAIQDLIDADQQPSQIGRHIRRDNPQMWVESKFAESVARALLTELSE
jgi:hypothetical protein